MTDDRSMKQKLGFLIVRDTMHQEQWPATFEGMGGLDAALPIPKIFPQEQQQTDFSYSLVKCFLDGVAPPEGRSSRGPSLDGRGEFKLVPGQPLGSEPILSEPLPDGGAQAKQFSVSSDGQRTAPN